MINLEKKNNNEAILNLAAGFMFFWIVADFFPAFGYSFSAAFFFRTIVAVLEGKSNVSELTGGAIAIVIISGFMKLLSILALFGSV